MLYLAKVSQQGETGEISLQLLARQKSEHHWVLSLNRNSVTVSLDEATYNVGTLVLVSLTRDRQVESVQEATDWVLGMVEKYLVAGITPNLLHEEAARAEEWRKELTLKTQDLARRALELETRRDQIQELEKKLEIERQQLEAMRLKGELSESKTDQSSDTNHGDTRSTNIQEISGEDTHPADAI